MEAVEGRSRRHSPDWRKFCVPRGACGGGAANSLSSVSLSPSGDSRDRRWPFAVIGRLGRSTLLGPCVEWLMFACPLTESRTREKSRGGGCAPISICAVTFSPRAATPALLLLVGFFGGFSAGPSAHLLGTLGFGWEDFFLVVFFLRVSDPWLPFDEAREESLYFDRLDPAED